MDRAEQFQTLGAELVRHRALWFEQPFKVAEPEWTRSHPELAQAVARLDDRQLEGLEASESELARWMGPRIEDHEALVRARRIAAFQPRRLALPSAPEPGVPGRKWQQILGFVRCMCDSDQPVLEWCSGKGHLGRFVGTVTGASVTCVERDPALAHTGARLAGERQASVDFQTLDALGRPAGQLVGTRQHAVALHACGELHLRLIQRVIEERTQALSLSPCCYHLVPDAHPRPLSRAGREMDPGIDRERMRLALQETVTSGAGVTRRRLAGQARRLGFDQLQRQLRGADEYLPVPPFPGAWLKLDFDRFCHRMAALKQLSIPAGMDLSEFETEGQARLARVRRFSLVRHAFRRALEVWLVLDRAQHLAEAGYRVELGTFCERRVTPRNLMIRAYWD